MQSTKWKSRFRRTLNLLSYFVLCTSNFLPRLGQQGRGRGRVVHGEAVSADAVVGMQGSGHGTGGRHAANLADALGAVAANLVRHLEEERRRLNR